MTDIILYPGETNSADIRLRDPTLVVAPVPVAIVQTPGAFGDLSFGDDRTLYMRINVSLSIKVDFQYRIYVSTLELVTDATDTPPSQPYSEDIQEPLDFTWSIQSDGRYGGFVNGKGSHIINNSDAKYGELTKRYTTAGHPVEIRLGIPGRLQTTWPVVFKGLSSGEFTDDDTFEVTIEDMGYRLEVPVQARIYAGTGGLDGGADLEGKPRPLAFGWCENVEPPLVIPNENLFQVHDGRLQAIGVFDNAVALTSDGDYPSVAALRAATIVPGRYATCFNAGYFRIVNDVTGAAGSITCTLQGDKTDGVFAQTTVDVIRAILNRSTDLKDPEDLYLPSLTALNLIQPAPIGIYVGHTETPSVAEVIDGLIRGIGGFAGFRREGKFHVGRIDVPRGPPVKRFDKYLFDPKPKKQKLPDAVWPPASRWLVSYARNHTVQTDIAGSVSQDRRAFLAEEFRYASSADNASVKANYPYGKQPDPIVTHFRDKEDAEAEAVRMANLYDGSRGLYTLGVDHRDAALLNVGYQIFLQHDRGDLVLGRHAVLLDIHHKGAAHAADLLVLA